MEFGYVVPGTWSYVESSECGCVGCGMCQQVSLNVGTTKRNTVG